MILISFIYHQCLELHKENNFETKSKSTYISFNQNYIDSFFTLKRLSNKDLQITLTDNIKNEVLLEYSLDENKTWTTIKNSEEIIENEKLENKDYIIIKITNQILEEENTFLINIPSYEAPKILINYDITKPTSSPVKATIISTDAKLEILNNNHLLTYTFYENGEFTFLYIDKDGNKGSLTAKVDWITKDETLPLEIEYDIPHYTNKAVTATLKSNGSNITILNNRGMEYYTFKENGEFTFEYLDHLGQKKTSTAKVTWIDKTPPQAKIVYDVTNETSGEVMASLTNSNENILILNNEGKDYYIFKDNGEFTFEFQDEAGNSNSLTAKVTWIRKEENIETPPEQETNNIQTTPSNISRDAKSRKKAFSNEQITLNVPTYKIKEPLKLKTETIQLPNNIKQIVGTKSQAFTLSLENAKNKQSNIEANMKVSVNTTSPNSFLGVYQLNNDYDIEEIYYKRIDKDNIEFEISKLGNFILSYSPQKMTSKKINKIYTDLQIFTLFTLAFGFITTGIMTYKKTRV